MTWKKYLNSKADSEFGNYVVLSTLKELSSEHIKEILNRIGNDLAMALAATGYKPLPKTAKLFHISHETVGAKILGKFTKNPVSYLLQLDIEVARLRDANQKLMTIEGFLEFWKAKHSMGDDE